MRFLPHLIATDVRQFRWTIAGWCVLLTIQAVLFGVRPSIVSEDRVEMAVALATWLLWLAAQLMAIVLVPLIAQAHPAVGTQAFWMTRPIPRGVLVASKIILLLILTVAIPCAIEVVEMRAARVAPGDMIRVAGQTILVSTLWLSVLLSAAAITLNLARFALLLGGSVAAIAVTLIVWASILANREASEAVLVMSSSVGLPASPPPLSDSSAAVVGQVLLIAAALLLVVTQYRTRLRRYSIAVGAAAFVVAWVVSDHWPWPFLRIPSVVPAWAETGERPRLTAQPADVSFDDQRGWPTRTPRRWRIANVHLHVGGLEPGWIPGVSLRDAALTIDGVALRSPASSGYYPGAPLENSEEHPARTVMREVLSVQRLASMTGFRGESPVGFIVRTDDFNRYAPATGRYRGEFRVELTRCEIASILAIAPGASFQHGSYRLTILDVTSSPREGPLVRVTWSDASSIFDRRPHPEYEFYARNRSRSEAAIGTLTPLNDEMYAMGLTGFSFSSTLSGFSLRAMRLYFPSTYRREGSAEQDESAIVRTDSRWFSEAELVVVRKTRLATVLRTLEIADFPLKEPPSESLIPRR